MGAGAWAVSVEKSESAIFSQHEKTKQNFKSSMAASCVRKLARGFGSGDEQIMPKKNRKEKEIPPKVLCRMKLLKRLRLLQGEMEKVAQQQALVL